MEFFFTFLAVTGILLLVCVGVAFVIGLPIVLAALFGTTGKVIGLIVSACIVIGFFLTMEIVD